jgi:hypothetical protein
MMFNAPATLLKVQPNSKSQWITESDDSDVSSVQIIQNVESQRWSVARVLSFDSLEQQSDNELGPPLFNATPASMPKKRGRPRKSRPLLVEPENKRFTRSSLKSAGCRPRPVIEKVKPKHVRAKLLLPHFDDEFAGEGIGERVKRKKQTAATPIPVMQRVGQELGISPDKLSREKLEAAPQVQDGSSSQDD